jgi:WD40 repeat protein
LVAKKQNKKNFFFFKNFLFFCNLQMSFFGQAQTQTPTYNSNKDHELSSPPNDGISSLAWSPKANFLASGAWDNSVNN